MLSDRPLPGDLERRIELLAEAWKRDPDVAAAFLFGSRARGEASARSDVDLAVVLGQGVDGSARWRKRLALTSDACARLGTDAVDLVVLEDAPSVLAHRILRQGRLLCDGDPHRRVQVTEAVLARYFDEARLRAELDRALAERVREGRFAR